MWEHLKVKTMNEILISLESSVSLMGNFHALLYMYSENETLNTLFYIIIFMRHKDAIFPYNTEKAI